MLIHRLIRAAAMTRTSTILTVDDDDEVRQFACDVLSRAGFRVLAAESGEAALRVLSGAEPIDLVFTDIVMPGLNGVDLARQARRLRPQIRLLFASAYWPHIVTDLKPEELVSKPYRSAELVKRVKVVLAAELAGKLQ